MDELFNILSSSARINKSKRKKKTKSKQLRDEEEHRRDEDEDASIVQGGDDSDDHDHDDEAANNRSNKASRDRTGKRDMSDAKRQQIHREEIAAFRRSMAIRVAQKHDPDLPDPIPSFKEIQIPKTWWKNTNNDHDSFTPICRAIQRNIEAGKWKEPTPIQMQSIPNLLHRRDMIGAAPTGSGKSGAFIIPALLLSSAPHHVYYDVNDIGTSNHNDDDDGHNAQSKKSKKNKNKRNAKQKSSRQGEIRSLILAPARELATQLHREVERLGMGKPGGLSTLLLTKSNVGNVIAGNAGGKNGVDVMVATPLRLVDAIEKGMRLDSVRLVVLDEADRLLDASDGQIAATDKKKASNDDDSSSSGDSDDDEDDEQPHSNNQGASGSSQSQTFLSQIDVILSAVPKTAVRALFSATVTTTVRSLAESILRDPVDMKIAAAGSYGGANTDINQKLMFVGREDGKLLAIRQIVQRGELKPPAIIFVQSKDRAQALFSELLYDGIHVDVIHAGRSRTARDNAVARFRKGETWVLICTDLVARGVDFRAVNMVINYDLPTSGITYVHRIGRTGRAGRSGHAITMFTEADFENLRAIANVMKQSGCHVDDWMLQLKTKKSSKSAPPAKRAAISTTARYDKQKKRKKRMMIEHSKKRKTKQSSDS
mmetsp:Transcript_13352/g.38437  ORF Transcript_13352/g.38437 Transcript_13352/m.38437 type:complete len:654 (+) Transcript_13352:144-2105(+)